MTKKKMKTNGMRNSLEKKKKKTTQDEEKKRKEVGREGRETWEKCGREAEVVNRTQKDCEEPIHSWFNIQKSIHVIHHINKQTNKKKSHLIRSSQ